MRIVLSVLATVVVLAAASQGPGRAAIDMMTNAAIRPATEVVVFEHPDCSYCQAFRSRVLPRYQASPQAAAAPLRFVDISSTDTGRLALAGPLTMLPTVVVMKDGREVDRIAGYWAPDYFFKMLSGIIERAE